jgi:outer membrane protein assembly factor BamD (BamD/ComL family)
LPSSAAFVDTEPSVAKPSSGESQLEGEARALLRARAELHQGRLGDAFATLEAARRDFSAPELEQEREALMIELLYRGGQVPAARARAKTFLSRFPESPHAEKSRAFANP